jgi:hypothetical protein
MAPPDLSGAARTGTLTKWYMNIIYLQAENATYERKETKMRYLIISVLFLSLAVAGGGSPSPAGNNAPLCLDCLSMES